MHRTDMHIAIPPRPSPLSQDSTSSLSSSDQSASSTVSFNPAPGRCIHRPLDRPPTPYPGECQLCLAAGHMGDGKAHGKAAEPLDALQEEEEEPATGHASSHAEHAQSSKASKEVAIARTEREAQESSIMDDTSRSAGHAALDTSNTPAPLVAVSSASHTKPEPFARKRSRSWLKKLLSTDNVLATPAKTYDYHLHVTDYVPTLKPSRAAATSAPLTTSAPPSTINQNLASPAATAQRSTRMDPRCHFAPSTLMPTLDYSYTAENSSWKAPPVVGPLARRKQVKVVPGQENWVAINMGERR